MKSNFIFFLLLLSFTAVNAQNTVNDYVSRWHFENNADDEKGIQNGTPMDGVAFRTSDKEEGSYSAYFNGTSSYVEVPNNPALNALDAFTLSFWYKPLAYPTSGATFVVGKELCYRVIMHVDGTLTFVVATTNNPWYTVTLTGKTSLQIGSWYYITTGYDGNSTYLYVNGELDGNASGITGQTVTDDHNLTFGGSPGASSTAWVSGYMDDARFYNFMLQPDQIQALYSSYSATSSTEILHNGSGFNVYPNPANSSLNINIDNKYIGSTLEIYNITGLLIEKSIINRNNSTKDVSQYKSGLYLFKIKGVPVVKEIIK